MAVNLWLFQTLSCPSPWIFSCEPHTETHIRSAIVNMLDKYCCLYYRFKGKSSEPSRLVFCLGIGLMFLYGYTQNVWICKQSRKRSVKCAYVYCVT